MKKNTRNRCRLTRPAGVTLLELTIVLSVLLALVGILFIGTRAWARGSDRAGCMIIQRNVQMSVRSYQNLYGYNPGSMPAAEGGTQSIAQHLFDKGYIGPDCFAMITGISPCPGGGTYSIAQVDVFPLPGELYARCSLESSQRHALDPDVEW